MALQTHDKKLAQEVNNAATRFLLGLLTIVFITLKLTHVIDWSWWWVLGPLWIPATVLLGLAAVLYLIAGILRAISRVLDR